MSISSVLCGKWLVVGDEAVCTGIHGRGEVNCIAAS
jgi:hypothetical protein